ncbi:MAG: exostosin family protein, partial [Patescibacteria group bacterium]
IEDADYVLVPYHYDRLKAANPERLAMIIREAQEAHKPLLIDGAGDLEPHIDIPNSVVMRVSRYQYSVSPNEVTLPFPTEDLLMRYREGKLVLRKKTQVPSVGFTGWAAQSGVAKLKTWIKELPVTTRALLDDKLGAEQKGILFRAQALAALKNSSRVIANVTARSTYSGHTKTMSGEAHDIRKEFVDALDGSDYALCVRGDANASVRFYEALSLGRIPLFLDTACVLPCENKIDYRSFCVFVDWKDTDRIADKLADFHASISEEQFETMQRAARTAYEKHLRIDAFSHELADMLSKTDGFLQAEGSIVESVSWKQSQKS